MLEPPFHHLLQLYKGQQISARQNPIDSVKTVKYASKVVELYNSGLS